MKKSILFLVLALVNVSAFAQGMKKVHLSTSTKIISATEAELVITAKMDKGWHLYSFNPGGDGSLIAPEIKITKTSAIELIGKVKEVGKLHTQDIDGVGTIHYFKDKVDYVQKVKYTKVDKIRANVS